MDTTNAVEGERAIYVREIGPRIRYTLIFQTFGHLDDLRARQLVDRDLRLLRLQREAKHGNCCRWTYLEQGPGLWPVRLQSDHPRTVIPRSGL